MTSQPRSDAERRAVLRQAGRWLVGGTLAAHGLSHVDVRAEGPGSVTIALAQPHALANVPLMLAHSLGYFQAEGLSVFFF